MDLALIGVLLLMFSAVGALNALYFLLVTYGHLRPDPRWLPRVCRMDERTCSRIVHTKYGHVLGLSNAAYGLLWYAITGGAGVFAYTSVVPPFCEVLVGLAGLTLVFAVYLVWALRRRLHTHCALCYLGHAINAALFVLLTLACVGSSPA